MGDPTWFYALSPKAQKAYLKKHPNSKFGTRKPRRTITNSVLKPPGKRPTKAQLKKVNSVAGNWSKTTDKKAAKLFSTMPLKELRKRQSLAEKQMIPAYKGGKTKALKDLQAMHDALTREVLRRTK